VCVCVCVCVCVIIIYIIIIYDYYRSAGSASKRNEGVIENLKPLQRLHPL
jgi:hypothetical protein